MPCCSCAVFDVPERSAGVSASLRLASRSWMFLFSSVYFGMNSLNIVVSMLFFLWFLPDLLVFAPGCTVFPLSC